MKRLFMQFSAALLVMLALLIGAGEVQAQLYLSPNVASFTQQGGVPGSVLEAIMQQHAVFISAPHAAVGKEESMGWSVLSRTQSDYRMRSARHWNDVARPATLGVVGLNHRWRRGIQRVRFAPGSMPWRLKNDATGAPGGESYNLNFLALSRKQWKGLGIGVLAGAVVFGLGGLASGDGDSEDSFWAWTAEEKALMGAIGGGMLGGLIGLIITSFSEDG